MLLDAPGTALAALLVALVVDAAAGEPVWLYRRVPHPVVLVGRAVAWLEHRLLRPGASAAGKRLAGVLLVAIVLLASIAVADLTEAALRSLPAGWVAEGLVMSTLLAQRSLVQHVAAVAEGLRDGLEEGRRAVARIVGRDPDRLDRHGIGRAAVESLAENLSDGLVAPVFWAALAGLPGLLAYKALNTLDSMVGHRNERYRDFGWASARLDDLANLVPARLTGAALCLVGGSPLRAATTMLRDAPRHRSLNAGWPEAAMAASLGLRLAGPRVYAGRTVPDAWMGDARAEVEPDDIDRALALAWRVWWLTFMVVLVAALAAWR